MPSRVDRTGVERALRIVALLALVAWIANAARPRTGRLDVVLGGTSLAEALPRWTRAEPVDSVRVQLDTVPDAPSAAWLAALRAAGVAVSWTGTAIGTVALETYPAADPTGGVFVLTSAPGTNARVLSDALGPIDTLAAARTPTTVRFSAVEGDLTLTSGLQPVRASVASVNAPRRVFVSGLAGWEAKFVVAALEESGWNVDARVGVRPDHDVWQGGGARAGLDISRHAAVILLDSASAERTADVEQFARSGGGVVLAGSASRARRVQSLVAWRAGKAEAAPLGTLPGDTAWRGLSRFEFDSVLGRVAIALETRADKPVVAARRHYSGRVIGVGYDETWRWRMAGGASALTDHREWWSRVVASVAARPAKRDSLRTSAAPLAELYDLLGPPSVSARSLTGPLSPRAIANILGLICLASLLAEWMLRRARGAR